MSEETVPEAAPESAPEQEAPKEKSKSSYFALVAMDSEVEKERRGVPPCEEEFVADIEQGQVLVWLSADTQSEMKELLSDSAITVIMKIVKVNFL